MMNAANSPASTAKSVPRYQDLLRQFELVYHLAEEDSNDLFKLESLLEDFQISLLAKNEHKNHRNETSKVVSLFPSLDKKRKSTNFCCKF
jgi:ABC-type branched-subunit amino acid transport system ATPase component